MAMPMPCPDLQEAQAHLPSLLQLLTEMSLESMAELVPDDPSGDAVLEQHLARLSCLSAQVQVDVDKLNPRWNKTYGLGGTFWQGALADGRNRGGMSYYCPEGWVRFSLKVCGDADFEDAFKDWGYLYHGTKGKYVGSILSSGFRASQGLCYCGIDDHALYMSPSIEYCSHPRYSTIEYNPGTGRWVQVVLQCRVRPEAVWKKMGETLNCKQFGIDIDPNWCNNEMEWLFKPNAIDEATGHRVVKDVIVCTGIMMRVLASHPLDCQSQWWSKDPEYIKSFGSLAMMKIDPTIRIPMCFDDVRNWTKICQGKVSTFSIGGGCDLLSPGSYNIKEAIFTLGPARLSPAPFAKGHMRFAWMLRTRENLYVVKRYNAETLRFIQDGLGITEKDAFMKDVRTYLIAQQFAESWNHCAVPRLVEKGKWKLTAAQQKTFRVSFVKPLLFELNGTIWFGEEYQGGKFVKWNSNTCEVNESPAAVEQNSNELAAVFSHFTFAASKGQAMIVDVQGWDRGKGIMFTDPQIHTKRFEATCQSRKTDPLYQCFSVGNLGRTGILKFFMNHKCLDGGCHQLGLPHPLNRRKRRRMQVCSARPAGYPDRWTYGWH